MVSKEAKASTVLIAVTGSFAKKKTFASVNKP
jgi:hypothetical protein